MEGWSIFITELKQHIVYPDKTFILVYCVLYMYMWCATSAYVFVDGSFYDKEVHEKMLTYVFEKPFLFFYVFAVSDWVIYFTFINTLFFISVKNESLSVISSAYCYCSEVVPISVIYLACKIFFEATLLQLKIHPIYLLKHNPKLFIFYRYMLTMLPGFLYLLAFTTASDNSIFACF